MNRRDALIGLAAGVAAGLGIAGGVPANPFGAEPMQDGPPPALEIRGFNFDEPRRMSEVTRDVGFNSIYSTSAEAVPNQPAFDYEVSGYLAVPAAETRLPQPRVRSIGRGVNVLDVISADRMPAQVNPMNLPGGDPFQAGYTVSARVPTRENGDYVLTILHNGVLAAQDYAMGNTGGGIVR